MLRVTRDIALDESEIEERFIRASGPGGQNVNKVATAVQLRFDVARSPALPEDVRARLTATAGNRINTDGILIITAQRFRTQSRNRADALARLLELIRAAAHKPRPRKATAPSRAERARRLADKKRRANAKRTRRTVDAAEW